MHDESVLIFVALSYAVSDEEYQRNINYFIDSN